MERRKIEPDKWYIVDLEYKGMKKDYQIFRKVFETKAIAKAVWKREFGDESYRYEVISGKTAIEFNFVFMTRKAHTKGWLLKYEYPPNKGPGQPRKSFRTKFRRWKRNYKKKLTGVWA